MAKEWIEKLANDIKHKDHAEAKQYQRAEHVQRLKLERIPAFFKELHKFLLEDCGELNAALANDVTASQIGISLYGSNQININRANFPFVSASCNTDAKAGTLSFRYAKAPKEILNPQHSTYSFIFKISEHDGMTLHENFGVTPRVFERPDELAKYIVERLFSV